MSGYQPNPGDDVLLTIRATVGDDVVNGCLLYDLASAKELESRWMDASLLDVVSVEPAPIELPTAFGAVIRADIEDGAHGEVLQLLPLNLWIDPDGQEFVPGRITCVVEVLFPGVES